MKAPSYTEYLFLFHWAPFEGVLWGWDRPEMGLHTSCPFWAEYHLHLNLYNDNLMGFD